MPITLGVDYAWERPAPKALYDAGFRFAIRYVSFDTTGKNLTRPELAALHGAGLAVVLNWEYDPKSALGGYSAGVRDADAALQMARALDWPEGLPIYFSVDFDAQDSQLSTVDNYFRGVADILPTARIGAYGGFRAIAHLATRAPVAWLWQTFAWSGGQWGPDLDIQQVLNGVTVAGVPIDVNHALSTDYGQWNPRTTTEGPIMTLTPGEAAQLHNADAGAFAAWSGAKPSIIPGDNPTATPVEYANALHDKVDAMGKTLEFVAAQATANGASLTQLSNALAAVATGGVDVDALAAAVMARLEAKIRAVLG